MADELQDECVRRYLEGVLSYYHPEGASPPVAYTCPAACDETTLGTLAGS